MAHYTERLFCSIARELLFDERRPWVNYLTLWKARGIIEQEFGF